MRMCACMCIHVEASIACLSQLLSTLVFKLGSLSLNLKLTDWLGWPANQLWDPHVGQLCPVPRVRLTEGAETWFLQRYWRLNPRPHACTGDTLTTEPSPQLL